METPDYRKAPKFASGPSKKKYDGMSAVDAVKADIRAKYGKGAIMDTKKKEICQQSPKRNKDSSGWLEQLKKGKWLAVA